MDSKFHHLVVHCKKAPFDVYIGRSCRGMPVGASGQWGNPFVMKNAGDRERDRVCESYQEWLLQNPSLVEKAKMELKGKILGCYCAPKRCHGHVLAEIANCSSECEEKDSSNRLSASSVHDVINCDDAAIAKEEIKLSPLIDIGINITSKQLAKTWRDQIKRANEANVSHILLTGTSLKSSASSLSIAETYQRENHTLTSTRLYCTVGIHPHDAKSYQGKDTIERMRGLLKHPLALAVGECGLDYNRNFSTPQQQMDCFDAQVKLACELQRPLFVHEREAHVDVVKILRKYQEILPSVVIHCFTGSAVEAATYLDLNFYIGFTGTICKHERGKHLRDLLPSIPLDRIMIETDAPWMGFVKGRRSSEPKDVALIAKKIAEVLDIDEDFIRKVTTHNAKKFFKI